MNVIEKELFRTKALRISGTGTPFWYASGTFGPFYINTHFLFGGEKTATETLDFINENSRDKYDFPAVMTKYALDLYNTDEHYKAVIDSIITTMRERFDMDSIDYISGGERRDWFFSFIAAYLLDKPHLTIYKNLIVMKAKNGSTDRVIGKHEGAVLHISDLVTKGSSYIKYWLPALDRHGFEMTATFTVVDRNQGGSGTLEKEGVDFACGARFDEKLFEEASGEGMITKSQKEMIGRYLKDNDAFMRDFIRKNPVFLTEAIEKDEKTRQRAIAFIKKNDCMNEGE